VWGGGLRTLASLLSSSISIREKKETSISSPRGKKSTIVSSQEVERGKPEYLGGDLPTTITRRASACRKEVAFFYGGVLKRLSRFRQSSLRFHLKGEGKTFVPFFSSPPS